MQTERIRAQELPHKISIQQSGLLAPHIQPSPPYQISLDTLFYPNDLGCVLHASIIYNPKLKVISSFTNCEINIPVKLIVDSCYFEEITSAPFTEECNSGAYKINFKDGFLVSESRFTQQISIDNVATNLESAYSSIQMNVAKSIYLFDCDFSNLTVSNNKLDDDLFINDVRAKRLTVATNIFNKPKNIFSLANCKLSYTNLTDNFSKETVFENDTLLDELIIQFSRKEGLPFAQRDTSVVRLTNCFINAQCYFFANDTLCSSKLIFDNCSFGSTASLLGLEADTLIFKNCTNMSGQLFLTAGASRKQIYIQFINSSVNNIRFDYTEHFVLFFDSNVTNETRSSTYQSLLAKYKAEGKPENIERIDVEYKIFEYNKYWYKFPLRLLDAGWWYYGYKKWLIIVWTLGLLVTFFLYNFAHWEGMQKIYSVFDKDEIPPPDQEKTLKRKGEKLIYILAFTAFIFFSLRIDFEKLKYTDNKYLLSFFIQYITGLICLFFLANAIFKLG